MKMELDESISVITNHNQLQADTTVNNNDQAISQEDQTEEDGYISETKIQLGNLLEPIEYFPKGPLNLEEETIEEQLLPPENFTLVTPFIYRSGFPKKKNFQFLKKLKLKSILTLILEDYPQEPFVDIPEPIIRGALAVLLDKRNHPILIHCNKGKNRMFSRCLRKLQHWSYTSIFDEYRRHSHPKSRSMDQQFIELFDISKVYPLLDPEQLPSQFNIPN
ncbi:hypothetical protein CONCODRAFT_7130 [Conidiobolus coronatus NRRL 28638]|uniref:Protein-tyrosine phosphatase n=1 Tax=Conidiobolus coronatus (strain ATCC 28846 / CBS 209.66 / NRRL 28638) TaxID=796925 RepID=A0A137P5K1_CONC2|nr:hypothetical protein CONCODRAFT_7130 [Conidiobolus coronatus NRRL 28638]|eukprot:KXN70292.1 hypothetical protein CONCODRAFT_7130 [Conidiobolus coronatus NRRL 28638]